MQLRLSFSVTTLLMLIGATVFSQPLGQETRIQNHSVTKSELSQKVVVITGARFSYKLVERWIDRYSRVNPGVQIIVESRGSSDPQKYDILAEVYDHDDKVASTRQYVYVARYAILPVATEGSSFAQHYGEKGLDTESINEIFFHNIFKDNARRKAISEPFTVYTRLQKAGVPKVFAEYFGREQKDIKGTAIAGADSHLLKALLRDSSGVSYLPLALIYDEATRKPIPGLSVLPVDLNGNKKVSEDENFYGSLDTVIETFEKMNIGEFRNVPIGHLHLSVSQDNASVEAVDFLKWVNEHGQDDVHDFGYLHPDPRKLTTKTFEDFAARRAK